MCQSVCLGIHDAAHPQGKHETKPHAGTALSHIAGDQDLHIDAQLHSASGKMLTQSHLSLQF